MKTQTQTIELLVDGIPYEVKATPYEFNTETRFRVSFNGSPIYIFVWDSELKRLTAIGEGADTIPANLEESISGHLLATFA
jgi:hypothetical protein